ncbi:hypothetical protein D9M72_359920 [compost metagenome]
MGTVVGMGDPARQLLRVLLRATQEGEHRYRIQVARLLFHHREIDGAAVDAWRRAGLQAALRQIQALQARRQRHRCRVAGAAAGVVVQPDVDLAVQEGAGGQHHRAGAEGDADLRHGADDAVALHYQVVNGLLEQHQVRLVLQPRTDRLAVQHAVRLGARGAYRRALAGVEDAELDAGLVRGGGHGTAHGVHFLDQVPLADAPDGRVAAHLAQRLDVVSQQQRLAAHTGRGECSFSAGMATTDDDDIEFFWVKHGTPPPGGWRENTGMRNYSGNRQAAFRWQPCFT